MHLHLFLIGCIHAPCSLEKKDLLEMAASAGARLRTALLGIAAAVQTIAVQFHRSDDVFHHARAVACVHIHTVEEMNTIGLHQQLRGCVVCKHTECALCTKQTEVVRTCDEWFARLDDFERHSSGLTNFARVVARREAVDGDDVELVLLRGELLRNRDRTLRIDGERNVGRDDLVAADAMLGIAAVVVRRFDLGANRSCNNESMPSTISFSINGAEAAASTSLSLQEPVLLALISISARSCQ